MTKTTLVFSFVFLILCTLSAQKSYVVDSVNSTDDLAQYNSGQWFKRTKAAPGLEGTGFIFEKFMTGQLYINDTTVSIQTYSMNIDAYTNEVKYMQDDKEYTIYNTNNYTGVILKDSLHQRYIFKRIPLLSRDKTLFLTEVLYQGEKFILYKHIEKRLHQADLNNRGIVSTGRNVIRFDEYSDYYIKKSRAPLEKILLKRGDFLALVAEIKLSQLEKYCAEHKIRKNLSEQEAVQLISILETL